LLLAGDKATANSANTVPLLPSMTRASLIEMTGSALTVTLNRQLTDLPDGSAAVQVTVVVPAGNGVPEGGLQTAVKEAEQLSLAEGVA
jgi:hypothetical protein